MEHHRPGPDDFAAARTVDERVGRASGSRRGSGGRAAPDGGASRPVVQAMQEDRPEAAKATVHGFTCGGTHMLYALSTAVHSGYSGRDRAERVRRLAGRDAVAAQRRPGLDRTLLQGASDAARGVLVRDGCEAEDP